MRDTSAEGGNPPVLEESFVALTSAHTLSDACCADRVKESATVRVRTLPVADFTAAIVEPVGSAAYVAALIDIVVFTSVDKIVSIRNVIVIEPSILDVENVGRRVIFDGV